MPIYEDEVGRARMAFGHPSDLDIIDIVAAIGIRLPITVEIEIRVARETEGRYGAVILAGLGEEGAAVQEGGKTCRRWNGGHSHARVRIAVRAAILRMESKEAEAAQGIRIAVGAIIRGRIVVV